MAPTGSLLPRCRSNKVLRTRGTTVENVRSMKGLKRIKSVRMLRITGLSRPRVEDVEAGEGIGMVVQLRANILLRKDRHSL